MRFLSALLFLTSAACAASVLPTDARFVMSHFKENGPDYGERLYISYSADGTNWTTLNGGNPVWQPATYPNSNFRDPAIIYASGYYWVAFTSGYPGSGYGNHLSFGLLKSSDLLNWTFVEDVPTTIPNATDPLTWNPTFFRDGDGSIHVFVSISPINGATYYPIGGLKTYELHPLNSDWTQWSSPVLVQLPGNNSNEFWCWKEGGTYHALYVNFGAPGFPLTHATSTSLLSGWGNARALNYNGEGSMMLIKPSGGYRLYFEPGNGSPDPGYRFSDVSGDFSTYTTPVKVASTVIMRNGKMIASAANTTYSDWTAQRLAGLSTANQAMTADPDCDGMPNLTECYLDTNPQAADAANGPIGSLTISGSDQFVTLRYRRRPQISDVSASVQASGNLADWFSGAGQTEIQSAALMSDGTELVYARDLNTTAANASQFLRLQIVADPIVIAGQQQILQSTRIARRASSRHRIRFLRTE